MEIILEVLKGYVPTLLQLVGTILAVLVLMILNKAKAFIVAKAGQSNYERALEVARGLYVLLEDEFEGVAKAGEKKKEEMENKLLEIFPSLTKTELDAINKTIWEAFNQKYQEGLTTLDGVLVSGEENLNE